MKPGDIVVMTKPHTNRLYLQGSRWEVIEFVETSKGDDIWMCRLLDDTKHEKKGFTEGFYSQRFTIETSFTQKLFEFIVVLEDNTKLSQFIEGAKSVNLNFKMTHFGMRDLEHIFEGLPTNDVFSFLSTVSYLKQFIFIKGNVS